MPIDHPAPLQIILLRHGSSIANEGQILQGQLDSPLSEAGILQARRLAQQWSIEGKHFDRIITSPLSRAHDTARILSELLPSEIIIDENWKERRFGSAEGLSHEDILSRFEKRTTHSVYEPAFETGESDWDLYIRAAHVVQSLTRMNLGSYLVVSNGAILNAAMNCIIGITPIQSRHRTRFRFDNTGYASLEYHQDNRWTIQSLINPVPLLSDNP
jgi:broad specificity phosphatase PhoE